MRGQIVSTRLLSCIRYYTLTKLSSRDTSLRLCSCVGTRRHFTSTNIMNHASASPPHSLYEAAIIKLNSLQSNAITIQRLREKRELFQEMNLIETRKFLTRCGITMSQLDDLNIIHVSGTKGKGSTCAFIESIFRSLGYKTGFYSSPHLVHVRERIRINGQPISEETFAHHFFELYNKLTQFCDSKNPMPAYFKFLTILAFDIFIQQKVDVAIIEVGIGGQYDCTNVIEYVLSIQFVMFTRHKSNTFIVAPSFGAFQTFKTCYFSENLIEKFSQRGVVVRMVNLAIVMAPHCCFQKSQSLCDDDIGLRPYLNVGQYAPGNCMAQAGIFKNGAPAIVSDISPCTYEVIKKRALEKKVSSLCIAPPFNTYSWPVEVVHAGIAGCHQTLNISLALATSRMWLKTMGQEAAIFPNNKEWRPDLPYDVPMQICTAIEQCKWPGRSQIIETSHATYYLDGAHTPKSIEMCAKWFMNEMASHKSRLRILLFHCTADRNSAALLPQLKKIGFNYALFCPTVVRLEQNCKSDLTNFNQVPEVQCQRSIENCTVWNTIEGVHGKAISFNCIHSAVSWIETEVAKNHADVLVTGSLHLVGGVISIVDPESAMI